MIRNFLNRLRARRRLLRLARLPHLEPILPVAHAGMVPPRYPRSPEATPGPFYVESAQCSICAWPVEAAPENLRFAFGVDGCEDCPRYCYIFKQPETREELELAIEAALGSCVEAARYCGTDPYVLARLEPRICDAL